MTAVQRWVIGTAEDCDIRITGDEYVSPRHAVVYRDTAGRAWVADLGSTNGTYARWHGGPMTKVVGPRLINPGVVIIVGRTSLPWTAPAGGGNR